MHAAAAKQHLEMVLGSGISHRSTAFQSGNTTDGHHGSLYDSIPESLIVAINKQVQMKQHG